MHAIVGDIISFLVGGFAGAFLLAAACASGRDDERAGRK